MSSGLLKLMKILMMVSLVAVIVMVLVLSRISWPFGIDFTGGAEFQIQVSQPDDGNQVRKGLESVFGQEKGLTITPAEKHLWVVRFQLPEGQSGQAIAQKRQDLQRRLKEVLPEAQVLSAEYVGSQVGSQLRRSALLSIFYSLLLLLVYIGFRFDFHFAVPAIVCLFHDVILTFGIYVLSGRVIQLPLVAALLTLVGYSLNDTIVVFDRIREVMNRFAGISLSQAVEQAVRAVWVRTFMTSLTTLAVSSVLMLATQGAIRDIAFILTVGIVIGTYSSVFVAAPLMMILKTVIGDRWLALLPKPRFSSQN